MKAVLLGVAASFFFACTFILNRAMDLNGGSWMWSASLRYFFMVPFLVCIVLLRSNLRPMLQEMRRNPGKWMLWSFSGFVLFYGPLTFAASFGPGWLIASSWQVTIISGILLTPFFYQTLPGGRRVRGKIPFRGMLMSLLILLGIVLMQWKHAGTIGGKEALACMLPIVLASVAYPLGNRKMMEVCGGRLDTFQRVLGMTLCSLPFWLLLSGGAYVSVGLPSLEQTLQCLVVAISSGVIATTLFFFATDLTKGDGRKLAAVEATQAGSVIFSLAGEVVFLHAPWPDAISWLGLGLVVGGMVLHSYVSRRPLKINRAAAGK
ncbi:DMT family transporter [Ectobacillus ponti]|uniref:Multidrug resistance efflux transporter family protein n=1 Tax=Ectobacillus ponti TaxID=2961894 RepID=A0AA41XA67_9BACI|nr:multidrug resistance efflux transporter family protein [Ectobacillus ponti]MCP8969559.1 multidrug resistance efflux transporter family protein [Ectobacillus ponti]